VYAGFTPLGTAAAPFTGTFEGLGHTISDLTIDRPTTSDVGLIGKSGKGAVIRDVGLIGGSVSGAGYVGALAGLSGGTVSDTTPREASAAPATWWAGWWVKTPRVGWRVTMLERLLPAMPRAR
jgi:hypothetical protein